jgi:hypothetical protein
MSIAGPHDKVLGVWGEPGQAGWHGGGASSVSLAEIEGIAGANETTNHYAMAQPDRVTSKYYHPADPTMATKPATAFLRRVHLTVI